MYTFAFCYRRFITIIPDTLFKHNLMFVAILSFIVKEILIEPLYVIVLIFSCTKIKPFFLIPKPKNYIMAL